MSKFRITWNGGFGEVSTIVDALDYEDAKEQAYIGAVDQFESNVRYDAQELSDEEAAKIAAETKSFWDFLRKGRAA